MLNVGDELLQPISDRFVATVADQVSAQCTGSGAPPYTFLDLLPSFSAHWDILN